MSLLFELAECVWPSSCLLCPSPCVTGPCCAEHALPRELPGPRCLRCAAKLPDALSDGTECAACRRAPPAFHRTVACWDYWAQPPAREHILAAKHRHRGDLVRYLGACLGARLKERGVDRPVLVPVPSHPARIIERGRDLAALLAAAVAQEAGGELIRALRRAHPTRSQGHPLVVDRRRNVRGAIALSGVGRRLSLVGRDVWLVDDVLTSGSTASECARVLHRIGARRVGVCVLARATRGEGQTTRTGPMGPGPGVVSSRSKHGRESAGQRRGLAQS